MRYFFIFFIFLKRKLKLNKKKKFFKTFFKKNLNFFPLKFFSSKNIFYFLYKKRFFLIKYWKNFKKKFFHRFLKYTFKKFFILKFFRKFYKSKSAKYLIANQTLIPKKMYKFFKSKLNLKKFFFRRVLNIFLKKFNFIKIFFKRNIQTFTLFSIKNEGFKNFFFNFFRCSNLNFFFLFFFQLKHLTFKTSFFFNWSYCNHYIYNYGVFVNGSFLNNPSSLIKPWSITTLQINWSWLFFIQYFMFLKYYKIQKKRVLFLNWLFYIRRYIQFRTPKFKYPNWKNNIKRFSFSISVFLDVNFLQLVFFYIPIFSFKVSFFLNKYINIFTHRLYLWKFLN